MLNPSANERSMARPRSSKRGATRLASSSNTRMSCSGKNTIAYNANASARTMASVVVANMVTESPAGRAGSSSATAISSSTVTASNTRSTTSDAKAAENGTVVSRDRMYGRTISPARPVGRRLFAMKPMAVARQSAPYGSFGAMGSRIGRHRAARSGNISVAVTTDRRTRSGSAVRTSSHSSPQLTLLKTHHNSPIVSARPIAPRQEIFIVSSDRVGARELDEVVQLLEQIGGRRAAGLSNCIANLDGAIERGSNSIEQRVDGNQV